jgi:hypothetical protein
VFGDEIPDAPKEKKRGRSRWFRYAGWRWDWTSGFYLLNSSFLHHSIVSRWWMVLWNGISCVYIDDNPLSEIGLL